MYENIERQAQYSLEIIFKLLNQVNVPCFEKYFAGQNPQDAMNNLVIVNEDNKMTIEWVEAKYSNLVRSSLNTVVRITVDLLNIKNKERYPEPIEEINLIDFLNMNQQKIARSNALFKKRYSKSDYKEDLVNLMSCLCGCDDVHNALIPLDFPDQESILGITVEGAVCSLCKEQYFLQSTVKNLAIIEGVLLQNKA